MPTVIEYLADEQLTAALVSSQDKKKIQITDARGRAGKVSPEKVLFSHSAASLEAHEQRLSALQAEVDVPLLWEMLVDEGRLEAQEAPALASLYFEEQSDTLSSAVFRALAADRLHFRRKGKAFAPRSREDLEQLREQQQAEARARAEEQELLAALRGRQLDDALAGRLERLLRGAEDRHLAQALGELPGSPEQEAFSRLLDAGRLPPTAALEVLQANLQATHPQPVLAHAASLEPLSPPAPPWPAAFSIDDEETREVDDVLSVATEGELLRVEIDIADVDAYVKGGDPLDREAQRRATTVYLPTGIYTMLPESVGCELASLHPGQPRPTMRTSVWLDDQGVVQRSSLSRGFIQLGERLSYDQADQLLREGQGPTAERLRLLARAAAQLAAGRRARGALQLSRREWKIRVTEEGQQIEVSRIPPDSPSRQLVAEMMILANSLAAEQAARQGVPIIYRVQASPAEPLPELDPQDPGAMEQLKRFLKPASLSLHPGPHWALGLEAYTQVSSPLRRYADLVAQRQLAAALEDRPPPYAAEELLTILANAEATEREGRRVEAAVTTRWALEYVKRLENQRRLEAVVIGEAAGGSKVQLCCCGAQGLLVEDRPRPAGEGVLVDVQRLRPRQGVLRVVASGSG